jgi:hypothetical protein
MRSSIFSYTRGSMKLESMSGSGPVGVHEERTRIEEIRGYRTKGYRDATYTFRVVCTDE